MSDSENKIEFHTLMSGKRICIFYRKERFSDLFLKSCRFRRRVEFVSFTERKYFVLQKNLHVERSVVS